MNRNPKPIHFLVTDSEIYRIDEVLKQLDEWVQAFLHGKLIRTPYVDEASLDEFEAHLYQLCEETRRLAQNDDEF